MNLRDLISSSQQAASLSQGQAQDYLLSIDDDHYVGPASAYYDSSEQESGNDDKSNDQGEAPADGEGGKRYVPFQGHRILVNKRLKLYSKTPEVTRWSCICN